MEETLASGRILRTYFDVSMNSQFLFLPQAFYDHERKCRGEATAILQDVAVHYRRLQLHVPPGSPVTVPGQDRMLARMQAETPEIVAEAIQRVRGLQH